MLGKLFNLAGASSKERSDSESGHRKNSNGDRNGTSGKKAAAKQKINQKLEDAFKADFEEDQGDNSNCQA